MRFIRSLLFLSAAACAPFLVGPARAGGPNVAVCMTLANAYNACIVDQQRRSGYDPGYGGGYDYDGAWDDDDYEYWREQRRAARAGQIQAICMNWLLQMKAANCY